MISVIDKTAIIRMANGGVSERGIAKQLSLSRNTVAKYLRDYRRAMEAVSGKAAADVAAAQHGAFAPPRMDVSKRKPTVFEGRLEQRFGELVRLDAERAALIGPNKQRANAAIIWRQLRKEGFDVGMTTVRKYFSALKGPEPECFVGQQYEYGEMADFDFHEVRLSVGGVARACHQTTISLPASNFVFVELFGDERAGTVMRGLIDFFRYVGGVPKAVTFDNLRAVVKALGPKGKKRMTDEMERFSAYYGFAINTCNPRKGNEKGHVENGGKLMRAELFPLRYEFDSDEELSDYVMERMSEANSKAMASLAEERKALLPLPEHDYLIGEFGTSKANTYSLVYIKGGWYSVPDRLVDRELRFTVIGGIAIIYDGDVEVARHVICGGPGDYHVDIMHFLGTFLKKPGALLRSAALRQAPEALRKAFERDFKGDAKAFVRWLMGGWAGPDDAVRATVESVSKTQLSSINKAFGLREAK